MSTSHSSNLDLDLIHCNKINMLGYACYDLEMIRCVMIIAKHTKLM